MTDISVIIPFVHEYPALIHTLFSIQDEFESNPHDYTYEIIVVENREVDPYTERFKKYMGYLIKIGRLKYLFEPTPCGPIARTTGARNAKGKYLIFTDAHVHFGKNTVHELVDPMEGISGVGIVHGCTVKSHWDQRNAGCHYKLYGGGGPSLDSHFHGTYQRCRNADKPYPVAGATLAYVLVNREEFMSIGAYNENCRYYPHPEGYIPLKYWMFDMECLINPFAYHYHSNFPRNHGLPPEMELEIVPENRMHRLTWNDHTIRNAMICAYSLGGQQWIDRIHAEWTRRGARPNILNSIYDSAKEAGQEDRDWISDNAVYTLNEVLFKLRERKVAGTEGIPDECCSNSG